MNITERNVKSLDYSKQDNKADLRFDDTLKGFGVRVYPSGRKSFIVAYRNSAGRKRRMTLGDHGSLTVKQARDMAQDVRAQVRSGEDPLSDKQARRQEMTFEELADRYMDHARDHKRSWKHDQQRLRDHLLPTLASHRLSEITLSQLQAIHRRVKKNLSSSTANRCAALVNHMFTLAEEWRLVDKSPAKGLKLFREPPGRDIALTPEETIKVLEACDKDDNLFAAALFKLCMRTGRRVGEWLNAKWSDLDREHGRLTIPLAKANERQYVVLTEPAMDVLEALPRIANNPYIIAGNAPGKPLQTYAKAWRRIFDRADLDRDYFPPHGLRHSYASMLVQQNVPLTTVGVLLGHKNASTTQRYAHYQPEYLRQAAQTFDNVIPLSRMRATSTTTK
jgi:integrase